MTGGAGGIPGHVSRKSLRATQTTASLTAQDRGTFDVASIRCPVTALHGRSDRMVDVIHAHHTAELIPGANLVIFDDLGHFGIVTKVVPAIRALLQR